VRRRRTRRHTGPWPEIDVHFDDHGSQERIQKLAVFLTDLRSFWPLAPAFICSVAAAATPPTPGSYQSSSKSLVSVLRPIPWSLVRIQAGPSGKKNVGRPRG
jgi:hypothetical protein